jgi:hypothetical protein
MLLVICSCQGERYEPDRGMPNEGILNISTGIYEGEIRGLDYLRTDSEGGEARLLRNKYTSNLVDKQLSHTVYRGVYENDVMVIVQEYEEAISEEEFGALMENTFNDASKVQVGSSDIFQTEEQSMRYFWVHDKKIITVGSFFKGRSDDDFRRVAEFYVDVYPPSLGDW